MKIMQSYRQWLLIMGLPLLCVIYVIFYYSEIALQIFRVHWLIILALAIVSLGPWGGVRLGRLEEKRYSWIKCFGLIAALQGCLFGLFLGVTVICAQNVPNIQTNLFKSTLLRFSLDEGLFPWAGYAVIAVISGFYSYCRKEDAYFYTLLALMTQHPVFKVIAHSIARLATMIAYSVTFALLSLLAANAATPVVTGFFLTPLLVSVLLFLLSITKIYKRNLTRSLGKEIPLIPGLFLWIAFLGVGIWLLNSLLAPITQIPLGSPSLLQHWLERPWLSMWLIFANSWWILWAPIIGITFARISRGYRVREVIALILFLPILLVWMLEFLHQFSWNPSSPLTTVFISGVALLGLFFLTLHKKGLPSFILVYLPRQDHYKFRSYRTSFIKLTQITVGFLLIYLPGGVIASNFILFAAALPLLLTVTLSSITLIKILRSEKK